MECYQLLNCKVTDFITDINAVPRMDHSSMDLRATDADPKLFLKPEVYSRLTKELGPLYSLIFEMKPHVDKKNIHVDIEEKTKLPYWPSLNLVIQGQGVMRWFRPSSPCLLVEKPNTHLIWRENYGTIIAEWNQGKVAIVRTDIPHNAWNFDEETRLVVSVRWGKRTSWEETKIFFNNLLQDL